LPPAGARGGREERHSRRRRDADGVQHGLHLRRGHDGVGRAAGARRSRGARWAPAGCGAALAGREVTPDSIEVVSRGNLFDAVVVLVGCDKTIPAAAMALARLNIPRLMLYGGSIAPRRFSGHDVTIQDVFEAVGAHAAGRMSDEALCELES